MEDIIRQLKPFSLPRHVKKGANIIFQGEVPRRATIIREGFVRAYTITSAGEERIVAFYGKGDIIPLSWLFDETPNSLFYYDAITDVHLVTVGKSDFMKVVTTDLQLLNMLMRAIGNQYTALLLRITGLEQSRAVEKIGFTLYYLLFRYGEEIKPGVYSISIRLSQLMLANLVGLTRESTTKNLKILKDRNIIEYERLTYIVHKDKLENFLGEDSFRDLSLTQ